MTSLLYKFFLLMLLRYEPQHIEYNPLTAIYTGFAYVLTGVIVLQATVQPDHLVQGMMLGMFVQALFIWMLLSMMSRRERFIQTMTAVFGVAMMFNLLAWPLLAAIDPADTVESVSAMQQLISMLYILLLSWEVLTKAHIIKCALEVEMISALLLSICLLFVTVAMANILLPQSA